MTILINPENQIKLSYLQQFTQQLSGYTEYLLHFQLDVGCYLSPLQILGLKQQVDRPMHTPSKSNVFSLGITIIEACLLQSVKDIYDFESFSIKEDVLGSYLHKVSLRYS